LFGGAVTLGMAVGAVSGGMLMKKGRRFSQFVCIAIGFVGIGLTMWKTVLNFVFGKFLFGLSVGLYSSIIPRYVEEMVPFHLFERIAPIYNFTQSMGTIFAYLGGELLPDDKDTKKLETTQNWRIIFFYFPAALYAIMLFLFIFYIRWDPVKLLI